LCHNSKTIENMRNGVKLNYYKQGNNYVVVITFVGGVSDNVSYTKQLPYYIKSVDNCKKDALNYMSKQYDCELIELVINGRRIKDLREYNNILDY